MYLREISRRCAKSHKYILHEIVAIVMTVVAERDRRVTNNCAHCGERSCGSPVEDRASGFVDAQAVMID